MEEKIKMVGVGYLRVSTTDQIDNLSLENQERACIKEMEKDGYTVLKVITDGGKSGGNRKRSGIKEITELIEQNKIQAVYSVHSDRIARDSLFYFQFKELLKNNNVALRYVYMQSPDGSPEGEVLDTVMAGFNQYHKDITSKKVKKVMREKALAGYFPSYPPIGYKNVKNPNPVDGKLSERIIVKDEIRAPLVQRAFELYSTGNYNVFDVSDILSEEGLRTRKGKKLSESRLYELLKNPFYKGELHWGEVHITDTNIVKHEPIIDEYTFNNVQKILANKNHHACRKRKYDWLLNGFIRCYKHSCRYTAEWHLDKKIAYYHCTNKSGCGKYFEQNKLENMVAEKFKNLEFSKEFIDKVIERVKNIFYERRKIYDNKRQSLINQRTSFEAKRRSAEDELISKTLTRDAFTRINNELLEELESIDNRLIDLEKSRNVNIDISKEILSLTENIYETYKKAPPILKKQYLNFFWDRFEVADGLIIKSVPSALFEELLRLEQAYQKSENTNITSISNEVINSKILLPG